MQITHPESLIRGITFGVRVLGECATNSTVARAAENIVVSGVAVLHVQDPGHYLALVLAATLELRVATVFTQPRGVGELERGVAAQVKGFAVTANNVGRHAGSDDLSHGTGVELVVLVDSSTVGASLESVLLELAVPFKTSETI